MTPGARVQAAIELLDLLAGGSRPADRVIDAYFRTRRFIGAGDRAAIAARFYGVLRGRAALGWWVARVRGDASPTSREWVIAGLILSDKEALTRGGGLEVLFDGGRYHPVPLDTDERALAAALAGKDLIDTGQPLAVSCNIPSWLEPVLAEVFGDRLAAEMAALNREAPLDLRVNVLKTERETVRALLAAEGVACAPTPLSPWGLRVRGRPPLAAMKSFRDGLFEVQDEGSQLVALLVGARPGMKAADFCSGSGGKTLALAAAMKDKGRLLAIEVAKQRLAAARPRLKRAGVHNVECRYIRERGDKWLARNRSAFDRVLVDAPCSGTGAWRRNPDARWRLSEEDVAVYAARQRRILARAARLVRPGGRLIYATCSILEAENGAVAGDFLAAHEDFSLVPLPDVWAETIGAMAQGGACPQSKPRADGYLYLTPAQHGTDGFFAAVLKRRAADAG